MSPANGALDPATLAILKAVSTKRVIFFRLIDVPMKCDPSWRSAFSSVLLRASEIPSDYGLTPSCK